MATTDNVSAVWGLREFDARKSTHDVVNQGNDAIHVLVRALGHWSRSSGLERSGSPNRRVSNNHLGIEKKIIITVGPPPAQPATRTAITSNKLATASGNATSTLLISQLSFAHHVQP